jgi:mRNA degradation ribonuclease J1/J2
LIESEPSRFSTDYKKNKTPLAEEIFGQAQGRVIVAMFSSNIHRIQEALRAAACCGRRVALCGKSMVRNVGTAIELGYMTLPHPGILVPVEETAELPDRTVAVLTTGSQGEPRSALTLMALGEHVWLMPAGLVLLGMVSSVLHLRTPANAWRAVANLRSSFSPFLTSTFASLGVSTGSASRTFN